MKYALLSLCALMMLLSACQPATDGSSVNEKSDDPQESSANAQGLPDAHKWPQGKTCYKSELSGYPGTMTMQLKGRKLKGTFITKNKGGQQVKGSFKAQVRSDETAYATFNYTSPPYKIVEKVAIYPSEDGYTMNRTGDIIVDGKRQPLPRSEQRSFSATRVGC